MLITVAELPVRGMPCRSTPVNAKTLVACTSGIDAVQLVSVVHVNGTSMPLTERVFIWIGAVPLICKGETELVSRVGPIRVKLAATASNWA